MTMRMHCQNCGTEIQSSDKLCPKCGLDCGPDKRNYEVDVGGGVIEIYSSLKGKQKDKDGFAKVIFRQITKIAGQTGRKAHEWLSIDRTKKDVTIKEHRVEEQTKEGEWETVHYHKRKFPAKRRPQEQQPKKEDC